MVIKSVVHSMLIFLFAAGAVAVPEVSSFGQYQPAPLYSEAVTTSQYLTMRDGVRLQSASLVHQKRENRLKTVSRSSGNMPCQLWRRAFCGKDREE